jgi:hypothetical protein
MADYPNITSLTDLDATTPAGAEVASKIDDAIRQIKYFLTQYLAVSHNADGTAKNNSTILASIANDLITYAKIQNVSATDKVLGRSTAGAGDIEEIACTAAGRALLDDVDSAAQRTTLGLGTIAVLNSIATANIDALAINAGLLATDSVTSAKIMAANVTETKIADANVTAAKLKSTGSNTVPKAFIGADTAAEALIGGVLSAAYNSGTNTLEFSFAGTTVPSSGAGDAGIAYARLEEQYAANTGAGGTTAATFVDRTSWVENDPAGMVSVSGAQITFAKAGVYWIRLSVPCSGAVGFHRCRLYNNTLSAQIKVGTTEQCVAAATTRSELWEIVTISTDNTVLKVQTWATNSVATTGLGAPSNQGDAEVYSIMEIVKL